MSETPKTKREAEIWAELDELLGPSPKPKPKVVTRDDVTIRDADVPVSKADKNYPASDEGVVRVRRPDYVTINMEAYEEQQRWKAEERQRHRQWLREHEPCRIGIWGPIDDEDD